MILNTCFAREDLSATMTCFSQQQERVVSSSGKGNSPGMLQNQWWNSELFLCEGMMILIRRTKQLGQGTLSLWYVLNASCLGRNWSIGTTIFRALPCCGERELLSGLYPYLGDSPRSRMYDSWSFDSRRTWNIEPTLTPLFLPHLKPFRDNSIVNTTQMLEFLETISDILQSPGQELCLCWSCPSDYHVAVESSVAWTKGQDTYNWRSGIMKQR